MDRFSVAKDIAELLPNMQVVIVAAYNLTNTGTSAQVTHFAEVKFTETQQRRCAYIRKHPQISSAKNLSAIYRKQSARRFRTSPPTQTRSPTPA